MNKKTYRPKQTTLNADVAALAAIKGFLGYKPNNLDYTPEKLQESADKMTMAQGLERRTKDDFAAANSDAVAAEWDFHEAAIAAKDQVVAQYGRDSLEARTIRAIKKQPKKRVETTTPTTTPSAPASVAAPAQA